MTTKNDIEELSPSKLLDDIDWSIVENLPSPDDEITIKLGDKEKKIFMSAGLQRELVSTVGSAMNLTDVFADSERQNELMLCVLVPRTEKGIIEDEYTIAAFPMTTKEGNKLISWIMAHCYDFFIKSMTNAVKLIQSEGENNSEMKKVQRLMQLVPGLGS